MRLPPSPMLLLDDFRSLFVLDTDDDDDDDDEVCLRLFIDDDDTTNGEEESKGVIRKFVR